MKRPLFLNTRDRVAPEHSEAVWLMQWVQRIAARRWPEVLTIFHVPNGGARDKVVAAKLKGEGVRAGVPDYMLPVPRGVYHGMFLELKRMGERPTVAQMLALDELANLGYCATWAAGWRAASEKIEAYLSLARPA